MAGRFVSIEGGEGAGKSTQARRLATALSERGIAVVLTREPGGSAGAEAIRGLLMQGTVDRWSARAEALLFAAARADHVERLIRPALANDAWVICDRFIDSTRAYQGQAGGMADTDVMTLHRIGSAGLLPDRTLVLDLPSGAGTTRALARDAGAGDRFAAKGEGFHAAVAHAFRGFAVAEPARVRLVDAAQPEDRVTAALLAELADLL